VRKLSKAVQPLSINDYGILSYSQEGEDVVLRRFVGDKKGFYVDIGAHHPQRFSNTFFYHQLGWRGLNIDADPDLIAEFNKYRHRDINVASGVGDKSDKLIFYVFNERAVNTFVKEVAEERAKMKGWEIIEEREIPVVPLSELLKKYLPKKQKIDFMSVDVEGKDLEVLKTNDWEKYRPRFLLIECFAPGSSDEVYARITSYVGKQRYRPVAKTLFTAIYADEDVYVGR
jgi:FkbM family methyltransferase